MLQKKLSGVRVSSHRNLHGVWSLAFGGKRLDRKADMQSHEHKTSLPRAPSRFPISPLLLGYQEQRQPCHNSAVVEV